MTLSKNRKCSFFPLNQTHKSRRLKDFSLLSIFFPILFRILLYILQTQTMQMCIRVVVSLCKCKVYSYRIVAAFHTSQTEIVGFTYRNWGTQTDQSMRIDERFNLVLFCQHPVFHYIASGCVNICIVCVQSTCVLIIKLKRTKCIKGEISAYLTDSKVFLCNQMQSDKQTVVQHVLACGNRTLHKMYKWCG